LAKISNLTGKKGHLNEIMDGADVFVGVSVGNVLKKEWVKKMNEKPIIFALANPDPEILPDDAK
jgi:malate dehydrogenase (oxaloacetate-decarboxylating)